MKAAGRAFGAVATALALFGSVPARGFDKAFYITVGSAWR
jgi:hypothetical protein